MTKAPSWRSDKRSSSERGYTYAWTKARNAYIDEHPLCVMCAAMKPPMVKAASVVDHIIPHQGDATLFWDRGNWQSLCKPHHDGEKAEQEGRHKVKAKFGADGRVIW